MNKAKYDEEKSYPMSVIANLAFGSVGKLHTHHKLLFYIPERKVCSLLLDKGQDSEYFAV